MDWMDFLFHTLNDFITAARLTASVLTVYNGGMVISMLLSEGSLL